MKFHLNISSYTIIYDGPIPLSHLGQVGFSHGILFVPSNSLNSMYPSHLGEVTLLCHGILLTYLGQVGLSYGIPFVPSDSIILCVRPIPLFHLSLVGSSHGIQFVPSYSLYPYVSVPALCPIWVRWNCPMESNCTILPTPSYVSIKLNYTVIPRTGEISYGQWDYMGQSHLS